MKSSKWKVDNLSEDEEKVMISSNFEIWQQKKRNENQVYTQSISPDLSVLIKNLMAKWNLWAWPIEALRGTQSLENLEPLYYVYSSSCFSLFCVIYTILCNFTQEPYLDCYR